MSLRQEATEVLAHFVQLSQLEVEVPAAAGAGVEEQGPSDENNQEC